MMMMSLYALIRKVQVFFKLFVLLFDYTFSGCDCVYLLLFLELYHWTLMIFVWFSRLLSNNFDSINIIIDNRALSFVFGIYIAVNGFLLETRC